MGINYDKELSDVYLDFNKELVEDSRFIFSSQERTIVWIVGIATASIALLVSQGDKLVSIPTSLLVATLIGFGVSVLLCTLSHIINVELLPKQFEVYRLLQIQLLYEKARSKNNDVYDYNADTDHLAFRQAFEKFDGIIGESLGYTKDEYENKKAKSKMKDAKWRERNFKASQLLYQFGIGSFALALVVFILGYILK